MLLAITALLCIVLFIFGKRTSPPDFGFMDQYLANCDKLMAGDKAFKQRYGETRSGFEV